MAEAAPTPFPLCGMHFQKLEDFFNEFIEDRRVSTQQFLREQAAGCPGSGTRRYGAAQDEGHGVCHDCGAAVRINKSGLLRAH